MADLTVMTWNIQNLFPVGHTDGPATQQEYDDKLAGLAEVINAVQPDVLALQEVGPEQVLADLNAACSINFDNRLVGSPDRRGIRVALLSPRSLSNRVNVTTYPQGLVPVQSRDLIFDDPATPEENEALSNALGRGVLSATVRAGDETVTVMVAHLKSKLISYDRRPGLVGGSMFAPNDEGERLRYAGYALYRRTAEAMTCRAELDTVLAAAGDEPGTGAGTGQDNPVIFCGDLNDEPLAATTQIIQGPTGSEIDFRPGIRLPHRRQRRRLPDVEPPPAAATRRPQLQPHLQRARRTHRPHVRITPACQPRQHPSRRNRRGKPAAIHGRRPNTADLGAVGPRRSSSHIQPVTAADSQMQVPSRLSLVLGYVSSSTMRAAARRPSRVQSGADICVGCCANLTALFAAVPTGPPYPGISAIACSE